MKIKQDIYKVLLLERKKLNLMGIPLQKNENLYPFFIVGSGRSGNTLLRRVLNNHSELYIPPETYDIGRSIRQSIRYPQMLWSDLVSLIYSNFEFHSEFETFEINSLNTLYQRIVKIDKNQQSVAYILNSFYEYYKEVHNIKAKRWGDKTPLNTFSMNEIQAVFPNAKFIHMVRNPYDSISSFVKAGLQKDIRSATLRWKSAVETAFEFGDRDPNNYMEVYYDELVISPESEANKVCTFLNLDYEAQMLETNVKKIRGDVQMREHHRKVSQPIDVNSIGKGMKSLNNNEVDVINNILNTSKNQKVLNFVQE